MYSKVTVWQNTLFQIVVFWVRRHYVALKRSYAPTGPSSVTTWNTKFEQSLWWNPQNILCCLKRSWDSEVGMVTGYGLDCRGVRVRVMVGSRIVSMFRPVLGPTQPPNQWVPEGKAARAWSWPLTSQLVLRSRKHPLPHMPLWHSA
jgi:hypothetical protein